MILLLDTGPFAWTIDRMSVDVAPSASAVEEMAQASQLLVSVTSLFEIGQKVRIGKWSAIQPFVPRLSRLADAMDIARVNVDETIALDAATLDWDHRDPFDRLIAATARALGCPLVTTDRRFDEMGLETVR